MAKSSGVKKPKKQKSIPASAGKRKQSSKDEKGSLIAHWGPLVFLGLSALIFLQSRLKLLAIPLERDEAGFAYIGHWLFKEKSLYVDMVDNKLPGLYILYGAFTNLFGYHSTGVHAGLLIANVASGIFFFFLMRDLFNHFIASISTAFFLLLVTSTNVAGFAAHATQLLLPFVLGGWLLFWKGIKTSRKHLFFLAGLLLGIAFIIKQQSVVFGIVAAGLWWPLRMIWNKNEKGNIPFMEWILLGIGGLLPLAAVVIYFAMTGRIDELYFWSYIQPSKLASSFDTSRMDLFRNTFPEVIQDFIGIWIASLVGLVFIWMSGLKKSSSYFGVLLAIVGLTSVIIGAAFYKHYFILALPGIALLAAVSLYWITLKTGYTVGLSLACILMFWPLIAQKEYFFNPDYNKIHQEAYSENMFPELEKIGLELSKRVPEGEKIGILGSEPEVLVAANRESCSKHLFMYPLLSDPETSPAMQQEYIKELQECFPQYIVWSSTTGSWTIGYDKLQMFTQLMEWVNQNYLTTGIAELTPGAPGTIVWDGAVQSYQPQSEFRVYVFKRK
ncbi:MAG TPA: glycosyltransferase family 39 protein [Saprospiraceae bacterium]|nr:glycosyltransferase family 39 protein [Saprospiraceae bacterium]